jgi:Cys-rich protein (TIGR01571 family)
MESGQTPAEQLQSQSRQRQRFSWQSPVDDDASYYGSFAQQTVHTSRQQPHINTDVPTQRHFSYAQTPAEHLAFVYTSTPNDPPMPQVIPVSHTTMHHTPIDPRPQLMLPTSPTVPSHAPPAYSQDEKPPVSPILPPNGTPRRPLSPVSPMPPQPAQVSQIDTEQSRHARQMSNLSPINTNLKVYPMPRIPPTPPSGTQTSPLPHKTPITPISAGSAKAEQRRDGPISPSNRRSFANEPYSPHGFTSGQTNNVHAVFSPDAAHGPNGLDFSLHQPGQIAHPNMESKSSHEWTHSLCACGPDVSTCLTGLACPCILYGRTSYRLSQKSAKKDPTDMLGHTATNGHCMIMGLSCGLWWLFPMLQRTRIRHAYKLGGSLSSDLLRGCCCCCCVAVQNEREVKSREEASRRYAGPASTDVYTKVNGMVYKPQQ